MDSHIILLLDSLDAVGWIYNQRVLLDIVGLWTWTEDFLSMVFLIMEVVLMIVLLLTGHKSIVLEMMNNDENAQCSVLNGSLITLICNQYQ